MQTKNEKRLGAIERFKSTINMRIKRIVELKKELLKQEKEKGIAVCNKLIGYHERKIIINQRDLQNTEAKISY